MTVIAITQTTPVLVAIDIAKARHKVLIVVPGKKRRRCLTVLNELADFNCFINTLKDYGRPVRAAFEATRNYHCALAYHLATAGFEVTLVSSVALARTQEALHDSWDKNDPKDAQVILNMMEIRNEQFYHDPLVRGANDMQEVSKTHDTVSKSKTELWHRILTHYLPLYFPEADRFHRSSRSDWFFAFLERYPSPHFISAMSKDAFTADAWDAVELPVALDSDAISMFPLVLGESRSLIAQRNQIEARAVVLLKDLPDYQLLTSIPEIGPINALAILAEAGDLRRFGHHPQFLKFCGMDLATIQSGTFRGQTKLSKYSNARLRRTLWMAGQVAILQLTNSFRDKFERYISKNRQNTHLGRKAYTATGAKMAVLFTGSSKTAKHIALSLRGDRSQEDLSL